MKPTVLPDLIGYQDLASFGVTRHRLEMLINSGEFERIAPGLFLRAGTADDTTAALTAIAVKRPAATICLLSALVLHDLTDEIPHSTSVAVPRGTGFVSIHTAPISWHRFDPDTFTIGREDHQLTTGAVIGLYSAERTIIDIFRLRHEWGADLAHTALRTWLGRPGATPSKLLAMAASFPKARPAIRTALEILL